LLPFSLGDVLYGAIIIWVFIGIFRFSRFLFKTQFKQTGIITLRFLIGLEITWLLFYGFWGLNYYRPPAAQLLNLIDTNYTLKDVAAVTGLIIDSANVLRACLDTADIRQTNTDVYSNALAAVNALAATSPKFRYVGDKIKSSMFSYILNYIGTSGYYNPFTSEAQLNYLMPYFDKPFTACHEMAHQTGWAREDEANFAGYLAGIGSKDKLTRYSAYFEGVGEFMRYMRRDSVARRALRLKISTMVILDFKVDSIYWTKYQGPANIVSGIFFDKFLKANNQPHGMQTYNRMIRLTMAYYRKRYILTIPREF
jgi:hypothetical protein